MICKLSYGNTVIAYKTIEGRGRSAERNAVNELIPCLFPDISEVPVALQHNPDGSPYLPGFDGSISVSHGGEIAIVARNDILPIGIDVEAPRQQLERVERKFVGEEDFKGSFKLSNENRMSSEKISRLLALWTAKEAVYKAASLPGLSLTEICVISPDLARIPDGRGYSLVRFHIGENLVTLATLSEN